ncbi:hypothetical protein [Mycobacterium shigaense]|uniref:Uncharacterized protein n=1 Tax=Mycobacterium shigaense TaxID=722731 RepID=A0A1Z4EGF4_9MYCO|nr:hypothetical protein [Mycobacterium shigaense]PRI16740.1 hypothetical protein B2J96_03560 [Mycobacterium shigaense]BAX92049.1 hypothetical protein MSG_01896 [Mycobacterium shigaense]
MQWFLLMVLTVAVVTYWPLVLGIAGLYAVYKLVGWLSAKWWAAEIAQRDARAARITRLVHNADHEHRLVQQGDMDGIYGDFPPPDPTRGIGIWLCDNEQRPLQETGPLPDVGFAG